VKALLRLGAVWNIPMACNVATADFLISSPLFSTAYDRTIPDLGPRDWLAMREPGADQPKD
jgi:methylglyoxal synthase